MRASPSMFPQKLSWMTALCLAGCGPTTLPEPRIDSITPASGPEGSSPTVTIRGAFVLAHVDVALGNPDNTQVTRGSFQLESAALRNLLFVEDGEVQASIPSNLGAGDYRLIFNDPFGRSAVLEDAYEVTPALCATQDDGSCPDGCVEDEAGCIAVCGDGQVRAEETCDDGNRTDRDGCSASCRVEDKYVCEPNIGCQICSEDGPCINPLVPGCGDGRRDSKEQCDDGNRLANDGCSPFCQVEPDHVCAGTSLDGDRIESRCAPAVDVVFVANGSTACITAADLNDDPDNLRYGDADLPFCRIHDALGHAASRLTRTSTQPRPAYVFVAPGIYEESGLLFEGNDMVAEYRLYSNLPSDGSNSAEVPVQIRPTRGLGLLPGLVTLTSAGVDVRFEGLSFGDPDDALSTNGATALIYVSSGARDALLSLERVEVGPSRGRGIESNGASFLDVRRSRVWQNRDGGISLGESKGFHIENSFIVGNNASGLGKRPGFAFRGAFVAGGFTPFVFRNNTVAYNRAPANSGPSQIFCGPGFDGRIENSLVRDNSSPSPEIVPSMSAECRAFRSNVSGLSRLPESADPTNLNLDEDVAFVDPASGDFHIRMPETAPSWQSIDWIPSDVATNPNIDGFFPPRDFDGDPRPLGLGTDVGADEVRP
jgi:cysteine-rich repeat protein